MKKGKRKVNAMIGTRLGEWRQTRGITAAALADRVGVRRQTIHAIEAGTYVPNTSVSLRLAEVLGVPVEQLFYLETEQAADEQPQIALLLSRPERAESGAPLRLSEVGDHLIAVPSSAVPAFLPISDGVLVNGRQPRRALVQPFSAREDFSKTVLVAGCDPAMSFLAHHMHRMHETEMILAGTSSLQALHWLKEGKVHIAGSHLLDERTGESNLPVLSRLFPSGGVKVVTFAMWQEGFVVAANNPKRIRSVEDLAREDVTIVNRQEGSGSRFLLDRQLRRAAIDKRDIKGYERIAPGHLAAAWHVANGLADCCIAASAAALALQLDFVPLSAERYDLVIPDAYFDAAPVQALLHEVTRASLRRELELLAGYDTRQTGNRVL